VDGVVAEMEGEVVLVVLLVGPPVVAQLEEEGLLKNAVPVTAS
jgi:hypothetical protein